MSAQPKGLGKSFGSLLPEDFDSSLLTDKKDRVQKLLINDIVTDPAQPRKNFDGVELQELSFSIKRFGILQPIVVMPHNPGGYCIVAGERRYRAAQLAGLTHIPALIRSLEELERLEIALVENVQRVDLSPLEQAMSIARLNQEFNLSLQDIAARLGKAQTTIINSVRLLQLPEFARQALENRAISEGHARSVLALKNNLHQQKELVANIKKHHWSVRQAEQFVQDCKNKSTIKKPKAQPLNKAQAQHIEALQKKLDRDVKLSIGKGALSLRLPFSSPRDLESLLRKLSG